MKTATSRAGEYRPRPKFLKLGPAFFDEVEVASFPALQLRFRNQRWAQRVGLGHLDAEGWQAHFARFEPLPENLPRPLAMRYHGHQFRQYNERLGDGRGFLFAQLEDDQERLLDLATKGTGPTPWSRGGDGRLTLKGGVREILATEMLEALGVYTSKSFSLFETGESLERNDEPSPTRGSVLVRLGHSHIRFGSFQRHAFHRDRKSLQALLEHCLEHYTPELCHLGSAAPVLFLRLVVERSARLCASWMLAGFVHGVLNTDNMNICGESFDYGPFRFLPVLDPGFTAAYFDRQGLYAYGHQPRAVHWNLQQLAIALSPLGDEDGLDKALRDFAGVFEAEMDKAMVRRLGVQSRGPESDRALRRLIVIVLEETQLPFEQFFFEHYGARGLDHPSALASALSAYQAHENARLDHAYFAGAAPCTMLIDEVESIWDAIAERDDWSVFEDKIQSIRDMGEALSLVRRNPHLGPGRSGV